MKRYLLDTNILIYYFQGQPKAKQFVEKIVAENSLLFYSFITRLELLALPGLSDAVIQQIDEFLNELFRIDYNFEIEEKVLEIRNHKKVKLPEAIIAATALYTSSTLVTRNKKDFHGIKGLKVVNPID